MTFAEIPSVLGSFFPLEAKLFFALKTLYFKAERSISVSSDGCINVTVRSTFLRWYVLEAIPSTGLPITRLEIKGALFDDAINFEAASIEILLRFVECTFKSKIELSDAVIAGLDMLGGTATTIMADRLTVRGSLRLRSERHPIQIAGPRVAMLRLCGAEIGGNLDLRGSVLNVEHGSDHQAGPVTSAHAANKGTRGRSEQRTLFADGLKVDGSVLLGDGFSSTGEVCLNGCNIGRNLDCSGATLNNPFGYSLSAAGARIAGSAYFSETADWITYPERKPFSSKGSLRLDGAVINGELEFVGGEFFATAFSQIQADWRPDSDDQLDAILADGIRVGSNILFSQNLETKKKVIARGIISLINARVGGDFSCDGATLSFPGEEPLLADGLVVEGTTFLTDITTDGVLRFVQASLKQGCYLNGATFDASKGCRSWTKDRTNAASSNSAARPVASMRVMRPLVARFAGKT